MGGCTVPCVEVAVSIPVQHPRFHMAQDLEYKVVATGTGDALEKEVNNALSQGWKLYGPLAVAGDKGGRLFAQALVRGSAADSVHGSRGALTF